MEPLPLPLPLPVSEYMVYRYLPVCCANCRYVLCKSPSTPLAVVQVRKEYPAPCLH